MDKVKHWRNRDSVRQAREGASKKLEEAGPPTTMAEHKQMLRRRVLAAPSAADAA